MSSWMQRLWYGRRHPLSLLLLPFSWLYQSVSVLRRWYLRRFCQQTSPVPLIVVGNLTVGGVGKTPLVIALAEALQANNLKVGIVSRGYGAQRCDFPYEIQRDDTAREVGDEPLMMAQKLTCPVVIAPKRMEAVTYLLEHHQVQIIISDDGLQHYKMGRAIEIAVIDGTRGLGNGFCLPAGPLRESARRLKQVDFIVVNGASKDKAYEMNLIPGSIKNLASGEEIAPDAFKGPIAAVAATGNPQRFYSTLGQLGIEFTPYSYPDHYQFQLNDFKHINSAVIMTEKDAVKCRSFKSEQLYYLPVSARLDEAFWHALWAHQQLQGYL
jgi:tetraacyldisaccharide 4'-kinase